MTGVYQPENMGLGQAGFPGRDTNRLRDGYSLQQRIAIRWTREHTLRGVMTLLEKRMNEDVNEHRTNVWGISCSTLQREA